MLIHQCTATLATRSFSNSSSQSTRSRRRHLAKSLPEYVEKSLEKRTAAHRDTLREAVCDTCKQAVIEHIQCYHAQLLDCTTSFLREKVEPLLLRSSSATRTIAADRVAATSTSAPTPTSSSARLASPRFSGMKSCNDFFATIIIGDCIFVRDLHHS